MNNKEKGRALTLSAEIEKIIQEKKILGKESFDIKKSFEKVGVVIAPLAIFLLLFLIPIINIFDIKIKNYGELLIGFLLGVFLLGAWYGIFHFLILKGNVMSPWVVGFIEKAKGSDSGNPKKYKPKTNLFMGIFFAFFSLVFLVGLFEEDLVGIGFSVGFGTIFLFLGVMGVMQYIIVRKPQRILFLLRNNRTINILIFIVISLFSFSIIFSTVKYFLSYAG